MDQLQRYTLSVVLSYLTETEGTSFLITKKRYATQLLPIFRRRSVYDGLKVINTINTTSNGNVVVNGGGDVKMKENTLYKNRHTFVVVPVQDATVLLDRLNTKRLFHRRGRPQPGYTTAQLANLEWQEQFHNNVEGKYTFNHRPQLELLCFLNNKSSPTLRQSSSSIPTTTPDQNENDILLYNSRVLLVSYPRSGNTLVRTLLERVTGIVTGSDTRPDRSLSLQLAEQHKLVGEGITSWQNVWCCKTHWPERIGNNLMKIESTNSNNNSTTNSNNKQIHQYRILLVVRNPYDAIDSYWNMIATNSHTKTLTEETYQRFADKYDGLVRNEIHVWLKFHHYWLSKAQVCNIPILVVRLEDLIQDATRELTRILEFALVPSSNTTIPAKSTATAAITKTTTTSITDDDNLLEQSFSTVNKSWLPRFWIQRIHHVTLKVPVSQLGSYRPRTQMSSIQTAGVDCNENNDKNNNISRSNTDVGSSATNTTRNGNVGNTNNNNPTIVANTLHRRRYTKDQVEYIRTTCASFDSQQTNYLHIFGYAKLDYNDAKTLEALLINQISLSKRTANEGFNNDSNNTIININGIDRNNDVNNNSKTVLCINSGTEQLIRPVNCPYGRLLQTWRRQYTDKDTNPFPTIDKK